MTGILYLIPVPLGPTPPQDSLTPLVLARIRSLDRFIVEHAKTARAFLKASGIDKALQTLEIQELNEHTRKEEIATFLAPLRAGYDVGLLSEAGCPAVADPGADLVALAQKEGIRVVPLIGPSSLLLALMASGLNGQRFAFQGYLPAKEAERSLALRELENESRKRSLTQLFIETPYRNLAMFGAILQTCQASTKLTLATDLTLPYESVRTLTIQQWKKQAPPDIDRRPTVFLLLA